MVNVLAYTIFTPGKAERTIQFNGRKAEKQLDLIRNCTTEKVEQGRTILDLGIRIDLIETVEEWARGTK